MDITYSMVEPALWTMIESSTTIICAAVPAATPALKKILPTTQLSWFIEYIEDQFYMWRNRSTTDSQNPARRDPEVEPPAASAPTSRLDLTPI